MVSRITRWMLDLQVLLLRRDWMGGMGDFVMLVTTTGRRSGRPICTPIGYVRDGDTFLAVTHGPSRSQWYQNLRAQPAAVLEIRGISLAAQAEFLDEESQRQAALAAFQREIPHRFRMMFGVSADAPAAELSRAVDERLFVRFRVLAPAPSRQ